MPKLRCVLRRCLFRPLLISYGFSSCIPSIPRRVSSTRCMQTLPISTRSSISIQHNRSPPLGQLSSAPFPLSQNLPADRLIEERFDHINKTLYGNFNAPRLNDSFYAINNTLNTRNMTSSGYMFATLRAYNATDPSTPPNTTPTNTGGGQGGQSQGKRTSLAMWVSRSFRM